jgi:DNA/RNA-binding domain of Phe-tRNA-synthetase-like protein
MAVFGVAPAFVRASLVVVGAQPERAAGQAAAFLARASAAARDGADRPEPWAGWCPVYEALGFPPDVVCPPAALAAWAATPAGVPSLGAVLDLAHAFCLQHGTPVAAYDLAAAVGDLWLRPSRGIEEYLAPGAAAPATPALAEVVLADSADRVLARHWHGSPGRPFVPALDTRTVLVHVDLLPPLAAQAADLAGALARLLTGFLGGAVAIHWLDRDRPWAEWGP